MQDTKALWLDSLMAAQSARRQTVIQVGKYLVIAGLGWLSGFMYGRYQYGEQIAPSDCPDGPCTGGGSW